MPRSKHQPKILITFRLRNVVGENALAGQIDLQRIGELNLHRELRSYRGVAFAVSTSRANNSTGRHPNCITVVKRGNEFELNRPIPFVAFHNGVSEYPVFDGKQIIFVDRQQNRWRRSQHPVFVTDRRVHFIIRHKSPSLRFTIIRLGADIVFQHVASTSRHRILSRDEHACCYRC